MTAGDFTVDRAGTVTSPLGFRAGAAASGLKKKAQLDLAVLLSDGDCAAAGTFTRNQVVAAPVTLDQETLAAHGERIRGVVANAGNANACTGSAGLTVARQMQAAAAAAVGVEPEQFLVLSTGVIGVPLPLEKVRDGLRIVTRGLAPDGGAAMAKAIMTTDTQPKHLAIRLDLPEGPVTLGGIAKGSGMIHPNMATMLAVITSDVGATPAELHSLLLPAVQQSFNAISVDGDTSTNDTVLILANGASGVELEDPAVKAQFAHALNYLSVELAKMIVRDGEGVSKFVEIRIEGAPDDAAARAVAQTVATSPLVKTALAGSDANWGRILAAAGRAGVPFDQYQVDLWVGNPGAATLRLVADGMPTAYAEADAAAIFAQTAINVGLKLGAGPGTAVMWTGDLTHDYITINADYRT
ncbi:MAG: bifunctional glutamate N-acetyltransferase/amino-acid acetyltransferase ArgJ [Candidatus Promineifilaceae bacterium]|nr:bifunctional glutamate N-acetyltransferase/amino-acid acetyltransferase ArgJ [Candidatus Promineifilaceae bacterium]